MSLQNRWCLLNPHLHKINILGRFRQKKCAGWFPALPKSSKLFQPTFCFIHQMTRVRSLFLYCWDHLLRSTLRFQYVFQTLLILPWPMLQPPLHHLQCTLSCSLLPTLAFFIRDNGSNPSGINLLEYCSIEIQLPHTRQWKHDIVEIQLIIHPNLRLKKIK